MKLYDFRRCTCKLDGITCEEPYTADCVDCKAFKEYQKRIKLIKLKNIGAKSPDKEGNKWKNSSLARFKAPKEE